MPSPKKSPSKSSKTPTPSRAPQPVRPAGGAAALTTPSPTQTQEAGMKGGTAGATMERTSPSTAGTNAPVGNFPSVLSMIPALCGQIIGALEAVIANRASYEHYAGLGDTRPAQEWQTTLARSISLVGNPTKQLKGVNLTPRG